MLFTKNDFRCHQRQLLSFLVENVDSKRRKTVNVQCSDVKSSIVADWQHFLEIITNLVCFGQGITIASFFTKF